MKKKILYGIVVVLSLGIAVAILYTLLRPGQLARLQDVVAGSGFIEKVVTVERVIAPEPLKISGGSLTTTLDQPGVLAETNKRRQEEGKKPLAENSLLDASAAAKLKDMADKQYFEHISPDGRGPSDLAHDQGYSYILIGENLALGNFESDSALLDAWMASPGHRENILNDRYEQIGVAVGKVEYQGRMTWLAVQEFGKPASDCPIIDDMLKATIDAEETSLNGLEQQLKVEKAALDAESPQTESDRQSYNQSVDQYNAEVKQYQAQSAALENDIATYNSQVQAYNACIVA